MKFHLILLAFAMAGCSTSSAVFNRAETSDRSLFVSPHYTGYANQHLNDVMRTFEKHGFTITRENKQATYWLYYAVETGDIVEVTIQLMKGKRPQFEVSSINFGRKIDMFRPMTIDGRVVAAVDELDEVLTDYYDQ